MRALVFAQVTAVGACEVTEAAFVRFLALVQRANVRLELCVRCRRVAAAVADVRALACVSALVVVFGLVCRKCLGAGGIAACVRAVAGVAEEVTRELRTLLEVLGRGVARFPLAEAGSAIVNVGSLGVLVKSFGIWEASKAKQAWSVLPRAC
jgi:hypothetical protein